MEVQAAASGSGGDIEAMDTDEIVSTSDITTNGDVVLTPGNNEEKSVSKMTEAGNDDCMVVSSSSDGATEEIKSSESTLLTVTSLPAPVITICEENTQVIPVSETRTPPSSEQMIRYLLATRKQSCEAVETAALDYVMGEVHHPVISCFREISRADINSIFSHARFRSESTEFEQGITCITLMDYIAASIKNPLYSETFSKSEISIRPCVKKVFCELRRVLRDWAAKDSGTFSSGKKLILKYLRGLTHFFKSIEYDKAYKSAIDLLEKDAARSQRASKPNPGSISIKDRLALTEIVSNAPNSSGDEESNKDVKAKADEAEHDLSDEIFDILDEVSAPPKKKPVLIFAKAKHSGTCKQTTLNWFKPKPKVSLQNSNPDQVAPDSTNPELPSPSLSVPVSVPVQVKSVSKTEKLVTKRSATDSAALKRPPSSDCEILDSPTASKKLCVVNSSNSKKNSNSVSSSLKVIPSSVPSNDTGSSSVVDKSSENGEPDPSKIEKLKEPGESVTEPTKPKINAFSFLMNRSKELAKEKKVKKQAAVIAHGQKNSPSVVKAVN